MQGPQRDVAIGLTAYRNALVFLDGTRLLIPARPDWKQQADFTIPHQLLGPGGHELRLTVENEMGPPLFHLVSDFPGLEGAPGWESTLGGANWLPALRVTEKRSPGIRSMFPSVGNGLRLCLPLLLAIFLSALLLGWLKVRLLDSITTPRCLRLLLVALWVILGINNMLKLDITAGFDGENHLEYIDFILRNHRLPLASDGLQMFQPPLYYFVQANVLWLARLLVPLSIAQLSLSLVPLLCALLLIEISYRLLIELFPQSTAAQSCGLLVAGLLPMNLYMCQFLGNEPLAAALTALLLFLAIKTLRSAKASEMGRFALLGIIAGLAILAKVTPLLLVPIICAFILMGSQRDPAAMRCRLQHAGVFLLGTSIVAGWFFVRNSIVFGKPFIGGWDPSRHIVWWQDPGYRLLRDYFAFGQSLQQPIFASFNGLPDGFYSTFWSDGYLSGNTSFWAKPPWNYTPLAAATGLSVFPASLIICGIALSFWRSGKSERWPFTFLLVSICAFLAALFHLHASLPIYSTAKASYTMGLTPAYAAMAALGAELIVKRHYLGPVLIALLITWAVVSYVSFFVLS